MTEGHDDVYELFRDKLDEIVEFTWTHDDSLKVWGNKINRGEHVLDAIARHMCEALTDGDIIP